MPVNPYDDRNLLSAAVVIGALRVNIITHSYWTLLLQ